MQKTCSCQGGNSELAGAISSDPANPGVYTQYQSWIGTASTQPSVISLQTMTLWDMIRTSTNPELAKRASDIQAAYKWIAEHPRLHETKCRLVINSDWGEVGLLTPSSFIVPDTQNPAPKDNTTFTLTKITWGKEHSHKFQRDVTIEYSLRAIYNITLSEHS